jgi:hypothetical protein
MASSKKTTPKKGYVAKKKAAQKGGAKPKGITKPKTKAQSAAKKGGTKAKGKATIGCAALGPQQTAALAKKYASLTNANVPFTWNHIQPGLNAGAQSKIRNYAKAKNLVTTGKKDPVQSYTKNPPPPPPPFVIFPAKSIKKTVTLPKTRYKDSDTSQFTWLNNKVKKADPSYNPKTQTFGNNPTKYTWHHAQDPPGTMLLVEFGIHNRTSHSGGRNVWGGGTGSR